MCVCVCVCVGVGVCERCFLVVYDLDKGYSSIS